MAAALDTNSSIFASALREGDIRRKLDFELAEIGREIQKFKHDDKLTLAVQKWFKQFSYAFKSHRSPDLVKKEYLKTLQLLLRDPILVPLDEDAILGSDGETYSPKSLSIYYSTRPESERQSSPFDSIHKIPFSSQPHLLARFLVKWLKDNNSHQLDPELEYIYTRLSETSALPGVQSERMRQLRESRLQRQRAVAYGMQNLENTLSSRRQEWSQEIRQTLLPIQDVARATFQMPPSTFQAELNRNQNTLQQLTGDITELELSIQEIDARLTRTEDTLSPSERELLNFRRTVNQSSAEILQTQQNTLRTYIERNNEPSAVSQILRDDQVRSNLRADLLKMNQLINESHLEDESTRAIKEWIGEFHQGLRSNTDLNIVKGKYFPLLQEILTDPILQNPLDENALLGSDDYTYSPKSLMLYLMAVSEIYQHRSPLNPDNAASFTTNPHPIVAHMVLWLKEQGVTHTSPIFDEKYNEKIAEYRRTGRPLPTIPTPASERMRERAERQRQAALGRASAAAPPSEPAASPAPSAPAPTAPAPTTAPAPQASQTQTPRAQAPQAQVPPTQPPEDEMSRRLAEARAAMQQEREQAFAEVSAETQTTSQNINGRIDAHEQEVTEQSNQLLAEARREEEEAEAIRQRTMQFVENLDNASSHVSEEVKELALLQTQVDELQRAIKERKAKMRRALAKTVAIVGACILVSKLLELRIVPTTNGFKIELPWG